jgi:hypothetical protein
MASDSNYFRLAGAYWESLAISHVMGWMFLGWAAWRMRRFVEKSKTGKTWGRIFTKDLLGGSGARRARLLDVNPVLWLLDDSRRLRWVAWLLSMGGVLALAFMTQAGGAALFFCGYVMWPFYFLLKVFFAIQACRFFAEARRTGALELLSCTPLKMRAVIQGQEMLLRRVFMWPLLIMMAAHLAFLVYAISKSGGMFGGPGMPGLFNIFFLYRPFLVIPNTVADFLAIAWFGMWLALSMQRPNMAAGLTLLCVVILPTIVYCIPTLVTDAIFIVIGVAKLMEDFRLRQAQWVTLKRAGA